MLTGWLLITEKPIRYLLAKEARWFLGIDDEKVYRIDRGMLEELAKDTLEEVEPPRHMSVR